jgi:signal peptidase I
VDPRRAIVGGAAGGAVAVTHRRPWLAALLSACEIGLGDVYNGELAKGAALVLWAYGLLFGGALGWAVATALTDGSYAMGWIVAAFAPGILLRVYGAARAWRRARALGDAAAPRRSWWVVGGYAVAVAASAMAATLVVRALLVQAYRMPSGSMEPTLAIGDAFLANKLVYGPRILHPRTRAVLVTLPGLRAPAAGDIVVLVFPKDRTKDFVKRIVATGGQTVSLRGGTLTVDGVVQSEPHARYGAARSNDFGPIEVPAGHVFVLGDNRNESYDSRFWGPVPLTDVLARAETVYWSARADDLRWERIGLRID